MKFKVLFEIHLIIIVYTYIHVYLIIKLIYINYLLEKF